MARILIQAIQSGHETLARDIIMKCASYGGIDSQTSRRDGTALFFCCSRGYLELAKLLLDRGASVASTDKNLATPLHGAVDNGHLDVVKLLIAHGANINAQTYRGDTPLHLAAYRGFGEITQCLVEAGADSRLLNSSYFTAENEAVGRGHQDVCNYLRTASNVHHLSDRAVQSFDSMILLDPPSLVSAAAHQKADPNTHNKYYQHENGAQNQCDMEVQRRKLDFRSDAHLRSKSCDYSTDRLNSLSIIAHDPPTNIFPHGCTAGQKKKLSQRHSTGRSEPTMMFPPSEMTTTSQLSPISVNSQLPSHPNGLTLTSSLFSSANVHNLAPSFVGKIPISASLQLLHSLPPAYSTDAHRRPSTGSTCSGLSDFSGCTGSDTGSLPSSGSDGSGFFSDARREDIELQDPQMVSDYSVDKSNHDRDLVLFSLGVRNPPIQSNKRQLSTTSESVESPDFSEIFDSTLFSLTSMTSGPRSSSISWPSSSSMDFTISDGENTYTKPNSLEVNSFRPKLNRATSVNCSCPLPNITFKVRPDYNKSLSVEYRQNFSPRAADSQRCPSFDRMPSNDLSSSFSMKDKPSSSMTCVNIPLN